MTEHKYWVENGEKYRSIFKDYTIGKIIGKGYTSKVYRCKNKDDDSSWACKVIQKDVKGHKKKIVCTEIRVLLKLDHPNIVRMKQIYETPREVYMILEFAEGGELFERIVKRGHYSEACASRIVTQMLNALDYIHSQGIVHRDIKPENILYQSGAEDSPIKIGDFGFAKEFDEDTVMKTFCGTLGYCAPEVVLNLQYTSAVDIWAVGVVLFILLCGYEPFRDNDGEISDIRIIRGDFKFISPYWDGISEDAKDFISELLRKDPLKRPSAKMALENPWVTGKKAPDNHLEGTQELISQFNAKRKFRVGAAAIVAAQGFIKSGVMGTVIKDECETNT